ncbi:hypothetical protein GUJ93_ZPchr0010g10316 [Zizania palustris]|uniref:hAT-like transposase RNase-H fold domain-containing protein n=1 Tax=Zizania palustris TaxID=103762 RepID=A0A8J6BFI0_ZIZPA|nr:hypothetical protein GUJ93_ZPchr0010g10316 [Zizania palustris]
MANSMNIKFDKYWKRSNLALSAAYFLDPRFKMKIGTEPQPTPSNSDFETKENEFTEEADVDFMNYVRLEPEIVEALICTKDWLARSRDSNKRVGSILNDLEVMETMDANLTLDDLEDMEKEPESSDEEE